MTDHLPALIFLTPFLTAISMPMAALKNERRCRPIALAALCVMSALALANLWSVSTGDIVRYSFSGWAPPIGIEWVADQIGSIMAVAASLLALVCVIYTGPFPAGQIKGLRIPYYTIVLLLISGLTGVIFAGDLFNIFVFLEIVALSGYALVAVAGGRALVSAFRYLIMGALGATFYLLGVGYFYAATGTLNIADLSARLPAPLESKAVIVGLTFMFLGLGIKMALMPLHAWLPDAYADAPDTAGPLLASLLTKVALLGWIRILFWVVGARDETAAVFALVWSLGVLASVGGAILALSQTNLKRMFAYGGIAHVGLILIAVGQATDRGLAGGLFYLINDAVMQGGLFILAGVIAHQYGARSIDELRAADVKCPWILGGFVVMAVSMIGLPPTGGFFGKWYIVLSAVESGNYVALAAVIITTLLTLAYLVRVMERLFRSPKEAAAPAETPPQFRFALAAPAFAALALGLFSDQIVNILVETTRGLGM